MIVSLNNALERLTFTSLKKDQIYKNAELIILDKASGGAGPDCALVKLENETWTVLGSRHVPNGNWAVMGYGVTSFTKAVLAALVKMNALSPEDVDTHIAHQHELDAKQKRKYAKEQLLAACVELGIDPPEVPE